MKIAKSELDKITREGSQNDAMLLVLMLVTKCPIVEMYRDVEDHLDKLSEMRESLGLEAELPRTKNLISSWVAKQLEQKDGKEIEVDEAVKDGIVPEQKSWKEITNLPSIDSEKKKWMN